MLDDGILNEILERRFEPLDLLKLYSSQVYNPEAQRNIHRNIHLEEYQSITQLMQPLGVYFEIIWEFAPEEVRYPLACACTDYQNHLYDLFERFTFESVIEYHFSFHKTRLLRDVYDPRVWAATAPEFYYLLVHKEQQRPAEEYNFRERGGRKRRRNR
jgi:hypothetical protein